MNRFCVLAAAAAFLALPADAATLDEIAAAMGTAKVQSLQMSGTGMYYIVGQQIEPMGAYPPAKLPRYARGEDYANAAIALDFALLQDGNMRSAGGLAFGVENARKSGLKGDQGWTVAGPATNAAPQVVTPLQHDLWTSPHGIVKAAMADKAAVSGNSFEIARPGKFKARATVNGRNLVEKVESWVDNPVLGDTAVVTTYADYKDVGGGVMVPTKVTQTTAGFPSLEVAYADIKANAGGVEVPAAINPPAPPQVTIDKAADGVWFISGGSHNSVAIEMADHLILVEAPLGDARTGAVIDAVKKQFPSKPIRTVIVTHVHFDHSGGARAAAAEDAVVVASAPVKAFFDRAYVAPRTIAPDRLTRSARVPTLQAVVEGNLFSDATRTVEIFEQRGNPHADGLIFVYLPKEKVLIEADAFSGPRQPITQTPSPVNPFAQNLWQNIERLHLSPEWILPIHGRMVKVDELKIAVGAK
jgi:glyoxylase-like metal-dependent hydrolase (beta-lactamase superfamily II)